MTQPTTTPTTDPVPSKRPADLIFNAELWDIATNSEQATVVDRNGTTRRTLAGAIESIAATNPRGAWSATPTPGTYALKDLVVVSSVVYICTLPHAPSGSFATDLAAGKWAVHKGVTSEDLALSTAASGVGFSFSTLVTEMNNIEWALNVSARGRNVLELIPPANWPSLFNGTGLHNNGPYLTTALSSSPHVFVPAGAVMRCDAMIELDAGQTLQLMGGARLKRFAAHSASTDPVVWVKSSGAALLGAGQAASHIQSENRAPKGVVRLGHKDMTESHANVTYCSLRNFGIQGAVAYGQTTGEPDVCLYMPNPQIGELASYFHEISGLRLTFANKGIHMHGWANGNTISGIHGLNIGNVALGADKNVFIHLDGALDNAISVGFFHQSANSIGVLVTEYNNTAVDGGSLHTPFANTVTGIVCEQGGASALGLKALAGTGSHYEIRSNVSLGNDLFEGFYDNNTLITIGGQNFGSLNVLGTLTASKSLLGGATSDTSSTQRIAGSQRIGQTVQRTYSGAGTLTVTVTFELTLTGAANRNACAEILFAGCDSGASFNQIAKYLVPISGASAWAIGTPVSLNGALTITQTASTASSVTFTIAGGSTSQATSAFVNVTAQVGARLS